MDVVEARLSELVKESRDQIEAVVAAISNPEHDVPADKVAVALASRFDGEKYAPLLLCTLAVMDVLSLRIKGHHDVRAAEVMGYFFRMLQPDHVMARACNGAQSSTKARVKGYIKRWVGRDCLTQQQCDEIFLAIENGVSSSAVVAPSTNEAADSQAALVSASSSGAAASASSSIPRELAIEVESLVTTLTALLQRVSIDAAASMTQRIAHVRFSGQLSLEHPTMETSLTLSGFIAELRAVLARETKQRDAETAAAQSRSATHSLLDTDGGAKTVGVLSELLHQRHEASVAEKTIAETDAATTPSYRRRLESDVGGHVGRIYAQPGHEFLLAGRTAQSDSGTFQPARSETTIRRPFRVPKRPSGAGYFRTWGITDEQWAVEKDMSRIEVVKPRTVTGLQRSATSDGSGGLKRPRD
ncbi:Hypothetical protein, putative [Bodo saltans]|uniref:Uncharacterized protein n=1 Tax=Bodo saltans TaxID=75058 RepID=A0A0S4J1A3_BODSA|nr:Hypothetical protein, putative [Bodo saltans]|eukprot:CUG54848.1 Hypothetical protein, putative [Bodo saltans]